MKTLVCSYSNINNVKLRLSWLGNSITSVCVNGDTVCITYTKLYSTPIGTMNYLKVY